MRNSAKLWLRERGKTSLCTSVETKMIRGKAGVQTVWKVRTFIISAAFRAHTRSVTCRVHAMMSVQYVALVSYQTARQNQNWQTINRKCYSFTSVHCNDLQPEFHQRSLLGQISSLCHLREVKLLSLKQFYYTTDMQNVELFTCKYYTLNHLESVDDCHNKKERILDLATCYPATFFKIRILTLISELVGILSKILNNWMKVLILFLNNVA